MYGPKAGLAVISEELTFDLLRDRHAMDRVLAATEPLWEPGTTHGYHVISFGFYVDALVRRVDHRGRTVGQFFAQEIAEPFGEYCWMSSLFSLGIKMINVY